MKSRQGFVSNSSSTSFIIASKEAVSEKLLFKKLATFLNVDANSPWYKILGDITNILFEKANRIDEGNKDKFWYMIDGFDNIYNKYKKDRCIYIGHTSDHGDGGEFLEPYLSEMYFEFNDDDFFILKDNKK